MLLRHRAAGINVDISCGALPFEREMIDRAQTIIVRGHQLTIATPEDLIITKVVAQRPKDIVDIESILDVHPDVDVDRIRYWVRRFAEALEIPELSERFEALLTNKRNRKKPRK